MLYWSLAGTPIAIYLFLIGSLDLRRRPLVTSGWRDTLTLGIACSGLAAIGPMQLFFPTSAASLWPGWVWLLLFGLYFLSLILVLLWSKPRLIVYGMSPAQFRDSLLDAARVVDAGAEWNGQVLTLPQAGIQLAAEASTTRRVHVVALVGVLQNVKDWLALERALVNAARQIEGSRSALSGGLFILAGLSLLLIAITPVLMHPELARVELQKFLLR